MPLIMNLFPGRIHCLRPSLPLNRSTPLTSSNAPTQASPPNSNFAAQYLVQSCGLSSDEALKASKYIPWLKSPKKPDAVLQFLRETGLRESDIKTAVSRNSSFLCSGVEKGLRPNIAKLQEVGFSIEEISSLFSCKPGAFLSNFVLKIDFWMGVLGSVENLSLLFRYRRYGSVLTANLENVVIPNLSLLQDQCGLSLYQIIQLIKTYPSVITLNPEKLKTSVKMVEELGIAYSSGKFVHVLGGVIWMNQSTLDARLNNLKRLGFSQEEVADMIRKYPMLLGLPEELVARKMEFLITEAGCDKLYVVQHPTILMCSLENRLIPRNVVRNLLRSKGLPAANRSLYGIFRSAEKKFVEKFVLPYEHAIPGLHQAYTDAVKLRGDD